MRLLNETTPWMFEVELEPESPLNRMKPLTNGNSQCNSSAAGSEESDENEEEEDDEDEADDDQDDDEQEDDEENDETKSSAEAEAEAKQRMAEKLKNFHNRVAYLNEDGTKRSDYFALFLHQPLFALLLTIIYEFSNYLLSRYRNNKY